MRINMIYKVKGLIEAKEELADSDYDLCWNIWAIELKNSKPSVDINKLSARDLFGRLKRKEIPGEQAIRRSRRKCQEKWPNTRGKVWAQRHNECKTVLNDLGY